MKIGFYNYYSDFNKNKMFLTPNSPIGDELSYPTYLLGKFLKEKGYKFSTVDIDKPDTYDLVIFFDLPTKGDFYFEYFKKKKSVKMFLFILESHLIRPENWIKKYHDVFHKVFTWNDKMVDSIKYFKFYLPNKLRYQFIHVPNKNFCTLIAGNKLVRNNEDELYSERNKAIRWFENNSPDEFDLYGVGWGKGEPKKYFMKLIKLNKFNFKLYNKLMEFGIFRRMFKPLHKPYFSYRGKVISKNETLLNYTFCICYENVNGISGYITEKIFDCFFAGCIPVYLGAPNIKEFIPHSTFIDKRDFDNYDELYNFLTTMTITEIKGYQQAISDFLMSEEIKKFSAEFFAEIVYEKIILEN
jgi:hypothetical protein